MEVSTTINGNGRFVRIQAETRDMSVLMNPGETPAAALQRLAVESRVKAARLLALADRCEAGADMLLTPAD